MSVNTKTTKTVGGQNMNISGKKMGNIKALKESLKKGGSSLNTFIKNVPAEGITVRFITEPEEWFGFYEYWNDESRNFVPMAIGEILPDGARASFRYLASAVDIETDRVIPIKLAKTTANSLILKYDKYGTMIDRNYELQKHGEGLDTTYDVTPDAPSKLNLAKYEAFNLEDILIKARASALGEKDTSQSVSSLDDDDIDEDEKTLVAVGKSTMVAEKPKKKVVSSASYSYETIFPTDDSGDETVREDYTLEELNWVKANKPQWLQEIIETLDILVDDDSMTEVESILASQTKVKGAVPTDDESGEEEVLDEETLNAMKLRDLRIICDDMGIENDEMSKTQMITAIIEASEK
jgi:hypothetical protein